MSALFSFGEWLKQRRSALLIDRDQLAQQVGCAEVTLRKIEADERRPSLAIAERLADLLEVQAEERTLFLQAARGLASAERLPSPIPRGAAMPPPLLSPSTPPALPSGTVTFLFTDIEASTQRWEQHPELMQLALARHDALLRAGIAAHGGAVVKSTGDGIHAVFARATDAVSATISIQHSLAAEQWGAIGSLLVRMALHTGMAEARDGDYFGPPLNRVARLLVAGHGGQVLLSLATTELVCDHLPTDAELRDLGVHRLKDLSRPEQIFQLIAPDLPSDFPPLNTLNARRTNLPAQPTALIGREQEVVSVCMQLHRSEVRLVTLTGPGGTGKTRLGMQVAAEVLDAFVDGVYLVNLAPIGDPTLVASAIAQVLGVTETGDQPLPERLQSYLRDKRLLLLLDNFEQIVDAAPLVAALLAECPKVKLLVTSRVPLHLRGEQEFAVPPLALPPNLPLSRGWERESGGEGDLTQYAAVQLFIQRALDVQSAFAVTNANALAVAEICARLDGLPLAIELAAARIKLFSPEALLARLNNRLALLTGGARDLPARQQTLRNAIAWSYDLLDESTQTLFARLGVFVGGCTLEAAEAVCGNWGAAIGGGEMAQSPIVSPQSLILDGLAVLVDNSLLKREEGADGEPRFVMLETIREYALERLVGSGELEAIQRRHADHFLQLAETADIYLQRAGQRLWLDRLDAEHDNLHAALAWAFGDGDAELGARLVLALVGRRLLVQGFWLARGYGSEQRRWLEMAASKSRGIAPAIRAALLTRILILIGGIFEDAEQNAMYAETLAIFRLTSDTSGLALALLHRGHTLWNSQEPDFAQSMQLLEEALAMYRALGDYHGIATALQVLGDNARDMGDLVRAAAWLEESVDLFRELDANETELALALNGLGEVVLLQGDSVRATTHWWEAVRLVQSVGDRYPALWPMRNLAWMALIHGDDGRVLMLLQEHVAWLRAKQESRRLVFVLHLLGMLVNAQDDVTWGTALLYEALMFQSQYKRNDLIKESLDGFAWLAAGQGQPARAARLLGATELMSMHDFIGWRSAHEHLVATARTQLGDLAFDAAWAEGQALTLEQAIDEALNR